MRVLVVGGTSFVGRAISWSAWHHGHEVTVVNRGVTPNDLPEGVERLVGDRRGDLSVLDGRVFDVTIDAIAYRPDDVRRLCDALGDRGGHHLQISSISAYVEPDIVGATEVTASLWPEGSVDENAEVTGETYGPLKAACERAALACFGRDIALVRPTYVVGSFDATLRFPYWVERLRRGGDVAIPGPRENYFQYVDARDLANFVVRCAEDRFVGAVHVAGPHVGERFVATMEQVGELVAPAGTTLHEVSVEDVRAAGLESRFPLWSGDDVAPIMALDCSFARSLGLDLRPLSDTVEDVVAWWGERAWPAHWLRPEDEARLLAR